MDSNNNFMYKVAIIPFDLFLSAKASELVNIYIYAYTTHCHACDAKRISGREKPSQNMVDL